MSEQEMVSLLHKISQQLVFLERKVDKMLQQSEQKPFNRAPDAARPPFRSFRPSQPGQEFGRGQGGYPHPRRNFSAPGKSKPFYGRGKDR